MTKIFKFVRFSSLLMFAAFVTTTLTIVTSASAQKASYLAYSDFYPEYLEDGSQASPGISYAYFDVTIDDGTSLSMGSGKTVTLKKGSTTVASLTSGSENIVIDGNRVWIYFGQTLDNVGDSYTLSIPQGLVKGLASIDNNGDDIAQTSLENQARDVKFTLAFLTLTDSSIKNGDSLPSYPAVDSMYFDYDFGSNEDYGSIKYDANKSIVLTKDGATYASWPVTKDGGHLSTNGSYPNRLVVNFKEDLDAGSYTLTLPAGIFSGIGLENGETTISFTITKALEYHIYPAPGNSASKSSMSHVTITYPATSTVTVNSGSTATLHFVKNSGSEEIADVSYTLSASGNVLTLSCPADNVPTSSSEINRNWFALSIPQGSYTVNDGGVDYTNEAMEFSPYQITAIAASDLTFTPALDTEGLTANDVREITLQLGENISWAVESDLTVGGTNNLLYGYQSLSDTQWMLNYGLKAISDDKKTLTLQMRDPSGLLNYTEKFPQGQLILQIRKDKLQDASGSKNGQMDINAWNLDGVTNAVTYKTVPADGDVLTVGALNSLELYFTRKIEVADKSAVITLRAKNSGENVTVKATEGTITTGSPRTVKFTNLFGNNTENDEYTFTIPAGTFRETDSKWINEEMTITCIKQGDFTYSDISPAQCIISGTASKPVVTAVEVREYYQKFEVTYPADAQIALASDWQSKLASCVFGETTATNGFNNNQDVVPTAKNGITVTNAEVSGNKLILTLSGKYNVSTTSGNVLCLRVAEGLLTLNGFTDGVPARKGNPALNFYYQGFESATAVNLNYENKNITLTTPDHTSNLVLQSEINEGKITLTGTEKLYFLNEYKLITAKYGFSATISDSNGSSKGTYTLANCDGSYSVTASGGPTNLSLGIYTIKVGDGYDNKGLYTGGQPTRGTFGKISLNGGVAVGELSYTIRVVADRNPMNVKDVLTNRTPAEFTRNSYPAGPTLFSWNVADGADFSIDWSKSIVVKRGGVTVATLPISNDYGYFSYSKSDNVMSVDLSKVEGLDLMNSYGEYTVVFPVGIFVGSNTIGSTEAEYSYTYNRIVNFDHTVAPASGIEVGDINEVKVTFTKADSDVTLAYDSTKSAVLTFDGNTVATCNAPVVDNTARTLTFSFSGVTEWTPGSYSLTIPADAVIYNTPENKPYPCGEAITASYTVKAADPFNGYLADHLSLYLPNTLKCNSANTMTMYGSSGLGLIGLGIDSKDLDINTACTEKVTLTRDGVEISSIACTEKDSRFFIMDYGMAESADDGSGLGGASTETYLYLLFDENVYDGGLDDYRVGGTYTLIIPDGAIKQGSNLLHGVTLNYVYDAGELKFDYALTPDPAKETPLSPQEVFANVTVTFRDEEGNAATSVKLASYLNDVLTEGYTLKDASGKTIPLASVNTNGTDNLTLSFGNASTDWATLTAPYTLEVAAGYVSVNAPLWNDDLDEGQTPDGNFKGLSASYAGPFNVSVPKLEDHITLSFPVALKCNKAMTTSQFGYGMMWIGLGLDSEEISINTACAENVTMSYGGELISSLSCADDGQVNIIPTGLFEEETGVSGGDASYQLFFAFDANYYMGLDENDESDHSDFRKDGEYTVVIPDGALKLGNDEMLGLTLVYNYTNGMFELSPDFYHVTPDNTVEIVNAPRIPHPLKTVAITFPGAQFVNCKNSLEEVTLTCPVSSTIDSSCPEEVIHPLSVAVSGDDTLVFTFDNTDNGADGKTEDAILKRYGTGDYKLAIPEGFIAVDSPQWDPDSESSKARSRRAKEALTGNVPAVNVNYRLDWRGIETNVTVIGLEKAESYNVFTPDGKAIRLNAQEEELTDLYPGIYIINGKKVYIRRK